MRDWEALVVEQLKGLALNSEESREVISELAAHLEESYESLRTKGLPEQAAMQHTLAQVTDWQDLRRRIEIARTMKENIMNDRVRRFWLPSLLTFVLATGLLATIQILGPKLWAVWWFGGSRWNFVAPSESVYIPWLLSLPLVGALGAYFSHRAGGSRRTVFSSIVFPVLPFLASILLVLPISLIFDHFIAHNIAPMSLVMALPAWVLFPGTALLAGGLPTQHLLSRRLVPRRIAGG
jgi:hypothetical protein